MGAGGKAPVTSAPSPRSARSATAKRQLWPPIPVRCLPRSQPGGGSSWDERRSTSALASPGATGFGLASTSYSRPSTCEEKGGARVAAL